MGTRLPAPAPRGREGFTLIEVIGALVFFSIAVLMAAGLTTSLSNQLLNASLRSEVVASVQQTLDSLSAAPYDSVAVGVTSDTLQLNGRTFVSTRTVIQFQARLREVRVELAPAAPPGPVYRNVSYILAPW